MKKKAHTAEFKFKVAIETLRGEKTTAELCQEFGIASSQLLTWRKALLEGGSAVFSKVLPDQDSHAAEVEKLHATIGRLKVENDFLGKTLGRFR
jgi:transposase